MPGDATLLARDFPHDDFDAEIAEEALTGLLASRKTLPPKLFYDEEGCRLFGEITRLPEYYVTRTERSLLADVAPAVAALVPPRTALVEYGASDEAKAEYLLETMVAPAAYVPIDVAAPALAEMAARLAKRRPFLPVQPVAADFLRPLVLPAALSGVKRLGFFPGSTFGNLEPSLGREFLAAVRATLGKEAVGFLVGIDLRKDPALLLPAYDDAAGVTAAFNLNLLIRLNREARGDFVPAQFAHRVIWNDTESRIEMHLESLCDQEARIDGQAIRFARGETIHTENSYKHTEPGFAALAQEAGWRVRHRWTDKQGLFALMLLDADYVQ